MRPPAWQSLLVFVLSFLGTRISFVGPRRAVNDGEGGQRPPDAAAAAVRSAGREYPYTCESLAERGFGEITEQDLLHGAETLLGSPNFWHAHVNPECPKFISAQVNGMAGIGHRYSNFLAGLSAALHYNVTYAFQFSFGSGVHGGYTMTSKGTGIDRGFWTVEEVKARLGIEVVGLGCRNSQPGNTMNKLFLEDHWGAQVRDASKCNVLYQITMDCWMHDLYTLTKPLTTYSFWLARHSSAPLPLIWDTSNINIAVHVRKGDVYLPREEVHARIVRDTILPQLRTAGIQHDVNVHVFAEFDGANAFPQLAALAQERGANGNLVNVTFNYNIDWWTTMYHFTQSDFFVWAWSGFSSMADMLMMRPLSLAPTDSNTMKWCHTNAACCERDGQCSYHAQLKTQAAAERLRAAEVCGLLDQRGASAG